MRQTDLFQMNTLVRVRETTLLTAQQKNALLRALDVPSAVKLLLEWRFFFFAESASPENVWRSLPEEKRGWVLWAQEIAPGTGVAEMFMIADTLHNLKVLLKEQITGKTLSGLYTKNTLYRTEDLRRLTQAAGDTQTEIPARWSEQVRLALNDYQLHPSPARPDFRLDAFYYEELLRMSADLNDPDIDEFVAAAVDLYHLSIVLQTRGAKGEVPQAALVRGGYLQDAIAGLLRLTPHEQDVFILDSRYEPVWERLILSGEAVLFDVYADDYLMELCKKAKLQAFGLFPLFAFLYAKLTDIQNVRLILTGKKQLLPEKELEKRLRGAYEI